MWMATLTSTYPDRLPLRRDTISSNAGSAVHFPTKSSKSALRRPMRRFAAEGTVNLPVALRRPVYCTSRARLRMPV